MSDVLNYLATVFLIFGVSCNSHQGGYHTVTTNASAVTANTSTTTTNTSNGIVSVKTLYKTPPSKSSGLAYYEYQYTDKFVPFLSNKFWKDNNQPKDRPILMQSYTETTSLELGHTDVITILSGKWVGELLILRKEKENYTKVLGENVFDGPCTFSNVRLDYLTNKKYPDFVISCVFNKGEGVTIYQWQPPATLTPLYEEGLFRSGPGKTAKPVYEIPPNEMKLYPNKIKIEGFGGSALVGGVEIKKIGKEIEVIEHTVPSDNYYKWNGKVFELIKVQKIKQ